MRQLTTLVCLFYVTLTGCFAQEFGCPLEEGEILVRKNGIYSNADPTYATTVFSIKQDNVQACLKGEVLGVIKSPEGLYTVLIRTGHVTVAYKYMQTVSVVKNQSVGFGSIIGQASLTDGVGYCLDISVWFGTKGMDASKLLLCEQTKITSKDSVTSD